MTAFIDVSCPKCGRRFGWCGSMAGRPPCPKCGHTLTEAQREKARQDEAEMDAFQELLRNRKAAGEDVDRYRRARVAAGLTLLQAAKVTGIPAIRISSIEQGDTPTIDEDARLFDTYGFPRSMS